MNLGPKSEAMMRRAGITTIEQLRALGAVRAYLIVKRTGANTSLNLLWALEGALTNRSWKEVARTERLSLLLQLEQLTSGENAQLGATFANRHRLTRTIP
jgi:DNA transformation protein